MLDDSLMKRAPLANWRSARLKHTRLRASQKAPIKRWSVRKLWGSRACVMAKHVDADGNADAHKKSLNNNMLMFHRNVN
jgi:hypothetical protein